MEKIGAEHNVRRRGQNERWVCFHSSDGDGMGVGGVKLNGKEKSECREGLK